MKPSHIIKKLSAFLLFCVFALGVTPKQVLHDALTKHQHVPLQEEGTWFGKSRFNCNDENLAAESPFVNDVSNVLLFVSAQLSEGVNDFLISHPREHYFFFELRGPPTVV